MSRQLGTIGFKQIVKNYQSLAVLGEQIILHKQHIKNVKPELLDKEFNAQENRIEQFFNNAEYCDKLWKNNTSSVNEFWTGY